MHDSMVRVHGRGNILVGVAVRCVRDDQGRLAHGSVTDKHAFDFVAASKQKIINMLYI